MIMELTVENLKKRLGVKYKGDFSYFSDNLHIKIIEEDNPKVIITISSCYEVEGKKYVSHNFEPIEYRFSDFGKLEDLITFLENVEEETLSNNAL